MSHEKLGGFDALFALVLAGCGGQTPRLEPRPEPLPERAAHHEPRRIERAELVEPHPVMAPPATTDAGAFGEGADVEGCMFCN